LETSGKHAAAQLWKSQATDRAQLTNEEIIIEESLAGGTADSLDIAVDGTGDCGNAFDFGARHLGVLVKLCAIVRADQQEI
jgi:hypothetical protein